MNNKNEVWKVNYTSFFNSKEIICILIKRQFQELFRDIFVKYARIYLHIQTYNLYVEYNNNSIEIPVQVGAYIVEFTDTTNHWAKTYIGTLAGMNILDGMGDNTFAPDGSLTRAQFVAMLAKMTDGIDITAAASAGFTDVNEKDWYFGYVNWGYENGIVNGMGDGTFSPNASITREQMAVMLCNYARSVG